MEKFVQEEWALDGPGGTRIIVPDRGNMSICGTYSTFWGGDVSKANARLIVKSQQMYWLLKEVSQRLSVTKEHPWDRMLQEKIERLLSEINNEDGV